MENIKNKMSENLEKIKIHQKLTKMAKITENSPKMFKLIPKQISKILKFSKKYKKYSKIHQNDNKMT